MTPSTHPLAIRLSLVALFLGVSAILRAQSQCGISQGSDSDIMPDYSGTLGDVLSTGARSNYVYILTNWGVARASLADPGNPSNLALGNVGLRYSFGTPPDYNGGKVPITCDCAQGGYMMAVAEDQDGSARMFSDWRAAVQGGGLPGQVVRANGSGAPAFAQQINVPQPPLGSSMAAIHLPASGKFIAYFPTNSNGLRIVDATNTTGAPSTGAALSPIATFSGFPEARLLQAATVNVGGVPKHLLVGVAADGLLRIADIDPSSGIPAPAATAAPLSFVFSLTIANVNNRVFLFSAELAGLQVYEYASGAILPVAGGLISGNYDRVLVRGGLFPAIFAHRSAGANSYIDIYDTKWLTQTPAATPRLAKSLPHRGAPVPEPFRANVFEAVVKESGPVVTAYVYRLKTTTIFNGEHILATDKVDISCIAADPTTPPVSNAIAENVSAQARSGAERTINYYGDKWRIRDASSTGIPLNRIDWDWNYTGIFQADTGWSATLPDATFSDVNPAYFPCDPAVGGNVRTGGGCHLSLGNPASGSDYRFAMQTFNPNPGGSPYVSNPIAVAAPQAQITGFSGGVLQVLTGGQADARPSQGNTAEATFAWNFTGGTGGTATGSVVAVPAGATSFSLTVTYPGGYAASAAGSVVQVDLVPDFAMNPNPSVKNGQVTLTNQMQIGGAVVNGVDYVINTGAAPSPFAGASLATSFNSVGGSAAVTAPATSGSYNIHLRYTYTAGGETKTAIVSKPLTVVDVTIAPIIGIYLNDSKTRAADFFGGKFYLSVGITYYLFDDETVSPHPGSQWSYFSGASETPMGSASGPGPLSFTFTNTCASGCSLKLAVSGVSVSRNISVTASGPPPPLPPPPSGSLAVSVTGPSTAVRGNSVTFNAFASGGTPPYSYAFRSGENAFDLYQPQPGSSFTFTYTAAGTYSVGVRATDATNAQAINTLVIVVTNPAGPPPAVTISAPPNGRVGSPVTFTATSSGGTGAHTYAWRFGENPLGGGYVAGEAVTQHTYSAIGNYTVTVRVTDSIGSTATASADIAIDPAFAALLVPGAAHLDQGDKVWGTDISVTNPGTQPVTITPRFDPYGVVPGATVDLSQISYDAEKSFTLAPGASWSKNDVVAWLGGGSNKGTLILRYDGGNAAPVVNARVYFASAADPLGASYGTAIPVFEAGPSGRQVSRQGVRAEDDQTMIGARSDDSYYFWVTLYNSSGVGGNFRLKVFDEEGKSVQIKDDAGALVAERDFGIGPYQQAALRNDMLGLEDASRRYVLKATKLSSTGSLVAYVSSLDRRTKDQVQINDDNPVPSADGVGNINYTVPGVSRFDAGRAKWRTGLTVFNPSPNARGVLFEYIYTTTGAEQRASAFRILQPGQLLSYDDVVGSLLDDYTPDDLKQASSKGVLRITYPRDGETAGNPLIIGARNYDDQPTGTAGTQLSIYSDAESVGVGETPMVIPGAEESARFRTTVGVFAFDSGLTLGEIIAVKQDGTVAATQGFALNQTGGSGRILQFFLRDILNNSSLTEPLTIRVKVLEGGRVGAYDFNVDLGTLDTSFNQARPLR